MSGTMSTEERAADLASSKQAVAEMSDAELYNSATSDEKVEEQPEQPALKTDATGRLHGADGKFASKEPAPTEAAPIQPQPEPKEQPEKADDGAQVPSWRLREVREAREAADRRAEEANQRAYAQQQQLLAMQRELDALKAPKSEPVDWFANPDAAIKQSLDPIEARFQSLASSLTLRASRAENVAIHGKEKIAEMETAIDAAMRSGNPEMPLLRQRMLQSDDPVGEAMQWYQRETLQKEVGSDVSAYKARILEEAMKDPQYQAKVLEAMKSQANGSTPKVQLPPSLNKVAAAARVTGEDEGDLSDASLYRYATR